MTRFASICDGDPQWVRRNGLAVQLWPVNTFLDGRITVGLGLGAHVQVDTQHPGSVCRLPAGDDL